MKNLSVIGKLTPQETGDLILCLLILRVVVENNENHILKYKYISDIESICKHQLDGEEIYNETLNAAIQIYEKFSNQF